MQTAVVFLNTRLSNAAEIDSVYSALRQQAVFCDSDVVITRQVHQVSYTCLYSSLLV